MASSASRLNNFVATIDGEFTPYCEVSPPVPCAGNEADPTRQVSPLAGIGLVVVAGVCALLTVATIATVVIPDPDRYPQGAAAPMHSIEGNAPE